MQAILSRWRSQPIDAPLHTFVRASPHLLLSDDGSSVLRRVGIVPVAFVPGEDPGLGVADDLELIAQELEHMRSYGLNPLLPTGVRHSTQPSGQTHVYLEIPRSDHPVLADETVHPDDHERFGEYLRSTALYVADGLQLQRPFFSDHGMRQIQYDAGATDPFRFIDQDPRFHHGGTRKTGALASHFRIMCEDIELYPSTVKGPFAEGLTELLPWIQGGLVSGIASVTEMNEDAYAGIEDFVSRHG